MPEIDVACHAADGGDGAGRFLSRRGPRIWNKWYTKTEAVAPRHHDWIEPNFSARLSAFKCQGRNRNRGDRNLVAGSGSRNKDAQHRNFVLRTVLEALR
jgi:hypothetical protein